MKVKRYHIILALIGYGLVTSIYFYDRWQSETYFDNLNAEFPVLSIEDDVSSLIVEEKSISPAYRQSSNAAYLVFDDGNRFFVQVGLEINTGQKFKDISKNSLLFIKKHGNDTIELRQTWEATGYRFVLR